MRKFLVLVLIPLCLCMACASTERAAYITTGGATEAVELARQAYVNHENTCKCVTQSEHDKVESYYLKYQAAAKLASDAITAYKSATVPNQAAFQAALNGATSAAVDSVSLIESLLPVSETTALKPKLPPVKGLK